MTIAHPPNDRAGTSSRSFGGRWWDGEANRAEEDAARLRPSLPVGAPGWEPPVLVPAVDEFGEIVAWLLEDDGEDDVDYTADWPPPDEGFWVTDELSGRQHETYAAPAPSVTQRLRSLVDWFAGIEADSPDGIAREGGAYKPREGGAYERGAGHGGAREAGAGENSGSERHTTAELIDVISGLERLKGCIDAAQARATLAFSRNTIRDALAEGRSLRAARQGVPGQVALARRCSPATADHHLTVAHAMPGLPQTRAALTAGWIDQRHAQAVVRETAVLSEEHRGQVDGMIGPRLVGSTPRRLASIVARFAAELDPESVVAKHARALTDRGVWTRPAPDGMAYLTVFGPLTDIVGSLASVHRHATAVVAGHHEESDPLADRTHAQVMADTALRWLRGLSPGEAQPVALNLVMPATSLMNVPSSADSDEDAQSAADDTYEPAATSGSPDGAEPSNRIVSPRGAAPSNLSASPESAVPSNGRAPRDSSASPESAAPAELATSANVPARIVGHGPLPAPLARAYLLRGLDPDGGAPAMVWLRRIFTTADGRDLAAVESTRRLFPPWLREALILRDDRCRRPYCDALIRHADHVQPAADAGPTALDNGQGLSARCNHTKDLPGFSSRVLSRREVADYAAGPEDDPNTHLARQAGPSTHVTVLQTPTGHTYLSPAPPLTG